MRAVNNNSVDFFDHSPPSARLREFQDRCARCGGHRSGVVDRETRQATAYAPSRCPDRDRCRKEIMNAAGYLDWQADGAAVDPLEHSISLYQLDFGSSRAARSPTTPWRAYQAGECERRIDLQNGLGPDLHKGWGATPRDAVADFLKAIGRKP